MSSLFRPFLGLLAVFVLAFGIAACGDDSDEAPATSQQPPAETTAPEPSPAPESSPESSGGAIQPIPSLEGKKIVVGSKNFPEQYILGEIYAQAFEAAGMDVEKQLDIGSEQIAYRTLKSGDIDAYPEYSGTALTSFYDVKTDAVPRDPAEAFDQLVQLAAKEKIVAMPQTQFENTYRVASTKETAEKYDNPTTISEVAERAPDAKLSGFPECKQRADCLLGLNDLYKWEPEFVSSDGQYADLDADQAEFTMAFTTDGPLATGKYVVYEDDKGLYPPYFVSLLVRDDAAQVLGEEGVALIEQVQEPLLPEVMQELNARVSVDKEKPEDVAAQYLQEEGFVE